MGFNPMEIIAAARKAMRYVDQKIKALESRVNNLASLKEGSTTGDAELMDIRTGFDGTVYETAGEAVRAQVAIVNEKATAAEEKATAAEERTAVLDDILETTTTESRNLFNQNDPDYLAGYYLGPISGTALTANAAVDTTGFIPVVAGDRITVYCNQTQPGEDEYLRHNNTHGSRIYGYDENKNYIKDSYSYPNTLGLYYYTVPENVKYLRISVNISVFPTQMIVKLADGEDGVITSWTNSEGIRVTNVLYEPYFDTVTKHIIRQEYVELPDIPSKVSELENDAGYLTKTVKPLALPPTLYTFANQPVVTFLRNILPYHPDDVYVRMITSNKGKLYSDRWEYTPKNAETVKVKYHVYDRNYNPLNDAAEFSLVVSNATTKESLTVLVIGDSTVNAGMETQKMLDLADVDGYNLTLLGTRGTSGSLNQHEGRGGWTAAMYVNNAANSSGSVVNAFYNPSKSTFDFSYYMSQQGYSGVDCVFIQLGINDLFSYETDSDLATAIETYLTNMETIINSIHAYDSTIKIVLNMIIPCAADQDAFTDIYGVTQTTWRCRKNTYDGNMALLAKFGNAANVYISHFNAALDTINNMDGGVHPVEAGYEQLGTQMYSFMRAIN